MTFAEGRKYDGKWKDDMAYGVGVFTGPGISFDGNWMNGKVLPHPTLSFYYLFLSFSSSFY